MAVEMNVVHVKNFRSIKDSKKIELGGKVTVFAGKNESGKTNILKAIQCFYDNKFDIDDKPVGSGEKELPEVKISFNMTADYITKKLEIENQELEDTYSFVLTRKMNGIEKLEGTILRMLKKKLVIAFEENDIELINFERFWKEFFEAKVIDENTLIEKHFALPLEINSKNNEIEKIKRLIKEYDLKNTIQKLLPKIVYFDSFEDMLPDELNEKDILAVNFEKNNRAFMNLLKLLDISKDDFISKIKGNVRNQDREFKRISKEITNKYNSVYLQEAISIGLNKNGDKVFVQIFDQGDSENDKKPSQRSRGFQWFLSFYLLLNTIDEEAIILIDEPGLYLHAKAQDDILNFLNKNIKNTILYTTHSPYLIDINKLKALKLVQKNNATGTIVNQRYYECKDQETITPLVTAIGYNVSKNPIEIGNGFNLILEGISDRFYLLSFLKLLKRKEKINLIPATGSSNMHLLVSLVIGWDLDYKILLDDDQGGIDAVEKLKELYKSEEDMKLKIVYAKEKGEIEDVFSTNDMKTYSISKGKKVTSAYNFFEKVNNDEYVLSDFEVETQKNIETLITTILKDIKK